MTVKLRLRWKFSYDATMRCDRECGVISVAIRPCGVTAIAVAV